MEIKLEDLVVEQSDRLGVAFPGGGYETYEALADAGFGRVRLGVSWERIQPTRFEWNYDGLDAKVTILRSLGIEPMLTFYSDAEWATREGDNRTLNDIPRSLSNWWRFIYETAARYEDFVDLYQVANEFAGLNNESGGWGGTPYELVSYVNVAHHAVKSADPGATFAMGGVASLMSDIVLVNRGYATFEPNQPLSAVAESRYTVEEARSDHMSDLVQARFLHPLRNARYDVADVHLYGDRGLDPLRIELMQDVTGRPVLSTESGAPPFDGTGAPTQKEFFVSSVMSDLSALAAGAEAVYWFQNFPGSPAFYNKQVPLRDADGAPKPSFWAKKLLANYLVEDAVVDAPAEGIYRIRSGIEGEALIGLASDLAGTAAAIASSMRDVWVLEDPDEGLLRRLRPGEVPSPADFAVIDTGWLAAAAVSQEQPAGELIASSALSFLRIIGGRTKIDQSRDGEVIDEFWYEGDMTLPSATLDRLGLTIRAIGTAHAEIGLGHGVMGVASAGEFGQAAAQIGPGEALAVGLEPTFDNVDRAVLTLEAVGIEEGEIVRLDAYSNGAPVAAEEIAWTPEPVVFDPGIEFDRVEISAVGADAFALRSLDVGWFH